MDEIRFEGERFADPASRSSLTEGGILAGDV